MVTFCGLLDSMESCIRTEAGGGGLKMFPGLGPQGIWERRRLETEDGFHLERLEFEVCEPSRLRRTVRYLRRTYVKRYILLVLGMLREGYVGSSKGHPHNHLCRNSQLIQ